MSGNKLFARLTSLMGGAAVSDDVASEDIQVFTPRNFVSGYIKLPGNTNPVEAAWHAAAVALDTERIRIVHQAADGGVYFLAAAASEFSNHPDAMTPLYSSMPESSQFKGDGAYFSDLGSGLFAVVVKDQLTLTSYVGERSDAVRFAGGHPQYFPTECSSWAGYNQIETRQARRLAHLSILLGMVATGIFMVAGIASSVETSILTYKKQDALVGLRAEQEKTVEMLNSANSSVSDPYAEYRKFSISVVSSGGKIFKFESSDGKSVWEASVPLWMTDLSSFGQGVKTRIGNEEIVITKGGAL